LNWRVSIRNGVVSKQDVFADYISKQKDGEYILTLARFRAKRSNAQNAFWHGVWLPLIADWMGELQPENACRAVKIKLGYCRIVTTKLGLKEWRCQSTADMNIPDMSEFLQKVEILMSELTDGKMILPHPDPENSPP
jgi:hypothetical protein